MPFDDTNRHGDGGGDGPNEEHDNLTKLATVTLDMAEPMYDHNKQCFECGKYVLAGVSLTQYIRNEIRDDLKEFFAKDMLTGDASTDAETINDIVRKHFRTTSHAFMEALAENVYKGAAEDVDHLIHMSSLVDSFAKILKEFPDAADRDNGSEETGEKPTDLH